jgi:hypothetical protein
MKKALFSLFTVSVLAVACVPEFGDDLALVGTPRILAVRATPAEARAGQPVTLTVLSVVPGGGPSTNDRTEWAMCLARKPLTELGPVAQECIDRFGIGGTSFLRLGRGASVTGTIPPDACQRFGPLTPPATANGVAGRPVDPDLSGGYHQPIVLGSDGGTALASVRLACGVVGVPSTEAARFGQGYRPNENPEIDRLEITSAPARAIEPGAEVVGATVPAGARLDLRVSWAACPVDPVCGDGLCTSGENQSTCAADCRTTPKGCTGGETYLWPNPDSRVVQTRREAITVAWFADTGSFRDEQTGRTEREAGAIDAFNVWTAPNAPGRAHLWVVIRDDRGGTGWREYVVQIE